MSGTHLKGTLRGHEGCGPHSLGYEIPSTKDRNSGPIFNTQVSHALTSNVTQISVFPFQYFSIKKSKRTCAPIGTHVISFHGVARAPGFY